MTDAEAESHRPGGEWSTKETLAHLLGDPDGGWLDELRRFLEEESPRLRIDPDETDAMLQQRDRPLAVLSAALDTQYQAIADLLDDLSPAQLAREATSPVLRDSPLGERRSLAQWADHLVDDHLETHIAQIRTARQANDARQGNDDRQE